MRHTKLGNSELSVSRICQGSMGFGEARNGQRWKAMIFPAKPSSCSPPLEAEAERRALRL